jgi:hypothetical protein
MEEVDIKKCETKADEFDKWLVWLKNAAIAGVFIFVIIIVVYFIHFHPFSNKYNLLSDVSEDWGAFGALLGGSSSLLASIGTVGVMLLGIKQFKLQQAQIEAQRIRQDTLEEKQKDMWALQERLSKVQIKKLRIEDFIQTLKSIEISTNNNLLFTNKFELLNSLASDSYLSNHNAELKEAITNFNDKIEKSKNIAEKNNDLKLPKISITCLYFLIRTIFDRLSLIHAAEPKSGDLYFLEQSYGYNLHMHEASVFTLNDILNKLQNNGILIDLPEIKNEFRLKRDEVINTINQSENYQLFSIHSSIKGYYYLLQIYFELIDTKEQELLPDLFSFRNGMFGIEQFKDPLFSLEFIKKARKVIDRMDKSDTTKINNLNKLLSALNHDI